MSVTAFMQSVGYVIQFVSHEMAVSIERHRRTGVPQHALERFYVGP